MALTTEQLYQARVWLPWTSITDAHLSERFDALAGDFWALVHEQLRKQLMIAVSIPAQFTIVGEYGQNTGANIENMRKALAQVEMEMAAVNGTSVGQLVRADPYRAGRTARGVIELAYGPHLL